MDAQPRLGRAGYAGVFLLTLATLAHEVLLTRIFSVTMWYHFAFMAISIAMFGMTAGAIWVFVRPNRYTAERAPAQLAFHALAFSVTIVLSFLTYLMIPYGKGGETRDHLTLPLIFMVISVPYLFSGVAVTLALTRFPSQVSSLYGVDLVGAALGAVLVAYFLPFSDGQTTIFLTAALGAFAALLFAFEAARTRLRWVAGVTALGLTAFVCINTWYAQQGLGLVRLRWVKGGRETDISMPVFQERWNSFSRISIFGDPKAKAAPWGWGMSDNLPPSSEIAQLDVMIDSAAGTTLTGWDGKSFEPLEFLKWDVTNIAHEIRRDGHVLVVGVGGGRDLLSAIAYGQRKVTGIEINEKTINAVRDPKEFGNFTGFADYEGATEVEFAVDEARSYMARTDDRFDILMVSLIDTWAATAAGAFSLTESNLYTVEAWRLFLSRLAPGGVISFSRWYMIKEPSETYRLMVLASEAMRQEGITDPRKHAVIILKYPFSYRGSRDERVGVATLLVSRTPFSEADLTRLQEVSEKNGFRVILSPTYSEDEKLGMLIEGGEPAKAFIAQHHLDLSAPHDDRPFFFHMVRLGDVFNPAVVNADLIDFNSKAVRTLVVLLITVLVLSLVFLVLPLWIVADRKALSGASAHLVYFLAIGLGFMLVEIAIMQRLMIFLGHPVYGLVVVLSSFLLFGGIGSMLTESVKADRLRAAALLRIGVLLAMVVAVGFLAPWVSHRFEAATTPIRILLSVVLVAPLATLMGMCFPLGMKAALATRPTLAPWLWGLNGAMSVTASVLAAAMTLSNGMTFTLACGGICYLAAWLAFASQKNQSERSA